MTYISLRELIDDILLIVRNNNISESEDLSRHQIAVWIRAYKQMILKDRLDKQKEQAVDDELLEDYIDDIFIREKGPLELINPTDDDHWPNNTKQKKEKLEGIYNNDESSILSVHDQNGCIIQYMNHVRKHYQAFRKYTGNAITAYYDGGYIYVQGLPDDSKFKYIWVMAIYEDIEDAEDGDDIDEDEVKIPAWLVPPIKNNILKNELSFMLNRPSDDSNNATLASVKPHGPQDEQQ